MNNMIEILSFFSKSKGLFESNLQIAKTTSMRFLSSDFRLNKNRGVLFRLKILFMKMLSMRYFYLQDCYLFMAETSARDRELRK